MTRLSGRAPYDGSKPSRASALLRGIGHVERDPTLGQALAQATELDLDDPLQIRLGQRPEANDVIDAVEELRLEEVPRVAGQVGRHDEHGVGEVDRAALTVGQTPVVQHLQEDVEHVGVGLLDLVEEDHRVRPATDRPR